jgi:hypothetical protein
MESAAILLHTGHARNAIEALLLIGGLVVALAALAIAGLSFWPRLRNPRKPKLPRRGETDSNQMVP